MLKENTLRTNPWEEPSPSSATGEDGFPVDVLENRSRKVEGKRGEGGL